MRPPRFWEGPPDHPAARLLAPAAALYGRLAAARMDRSGAQAPCPVICVGNLTLGGAGKTPTALALAAMLADLGRAPAFLTRGYGGRLPGPVAVDPAAHTAADVGDEPLLLARAAPTVVARDRAAGAALCVASGADAIVMDDGLQNPGLAKDLALAVVDAGAGLGNGRVVPAGPLRAPLARQWSHVGGLVLVGDGGPGEAVAAQALVRGLPVHRARLVPRGDGLAGRRVLAFAGIGRPAKFFDTLREAGAAVAGTRTFPDHHPYRAAEIAALEAEARRLGADLVTTEKDRVRLPRAMAVRVLLVRLVFTEADRLRDRLAALVRAAPVRAGRSP